MSFYSGLATKAVTLIAKYGTVVLFTAQPTAAADATKPWRGPDLSGAPITVSPSAVKDSFSIKEITGERIKETDLKLLVAGQDPALVGVSWDVDTTMFCDFGGRRYACLVIEVVKPADLALLYIMRLRLS